MIKPTIKRVEHMNEGGRFKRKLKIELSNGHTVYAEIVQGRGGRSLSYYGGKTPDYYADLTIITLHESWLMGGEKPL